MAKVIVTPEANRQISELPVTIRGRIGKLVSRLGEWPHVSGVKPLSGELAGSFRLRTGDYRLRFRVEAETILIEKVGHRRDFHEG